MAIGGSRVDAFRPAEQNHLQEKIRRLMYAGKLRLAFIVDATGQLFAGAGRISDHHSFLSAVPPVHKSHRTRILNGDTIDVQVEPETVRLRLLSDELLLVVVTDDPPSDRLAQSIDLLAATPEPLGLRKFSDFALVAMFDPDT